MLEHLFEELYQAAYTMDGESELGEIQRLALSNTQADDKKIKSHVVDCQRIAVNLPLIRKAVADKTIGDEEIDVSFKVEKGHNIICDVVSRYFHCDVLSATIFTPCMLMMWSQHRAMQDVTIKSDNDYLSFGSSLSESFVDFSPKETALPCQTSMIKVMAQMKNLRRGHDTQRQGKKY